MFQIYSNIVLYSPLFREDSRFDRYQLGCHDGRKSDLAKNMLDETAFMTA